MDLIYELRKCKKCSCSRCVYNGTRGCFIEVAIKELERYDQAMDSMKIPNDWGTTTPAIVPYDNLDIRYTVENHNTEEN